MLAVTSVAVARQGTDGAVVLRNAVRVSEWLTWYCSALLLRSAVTDPCAEAAAARAPLVSHRLCYLLRLLHVRATAAAAAGAAGGWSAMVFCERKVGVLDTG